MTILIEELSFDTILGILDYERTLPQRVRIDCTIDYLYESDTFINYADVASLIESTMQQKKFELIEEALDALSTELKTSFPLIQTLFLSIRKPDILLNCTVGVQNRYYFSH